ncbi:MAG: ribonuclease HII [SAR202 cluster bacterium Io17-Chloro-G9]|nr:MAG: ribonuclease HII [SAR202 cluster bacterium Io17-Chloro-G9]
MPDLTLEQELHRRGVNLVAGVDEAGRGPLAGPVVAAAVILPPDLTGNEPWLELLDDSKRLSPAQRVRAVEAVQKHAVGVGVAQSSPQEIDNLGIGVATTEAMMRAVENLAWQPAYLLLDFVYISSCPLPYDTVVKGDSRSYSIAAASNIAKVTRDRLMQEADALYPGYFFARHKGYPTADHVARLKALGPCRIHRYSFGPVRDAAAQPADAAGIA